MNTEINETTGRFIPTWMEEGMDVIKKDAPETVYRVEYVGHATSHLKNANNDFIAVHHSDVSDYQAVLLNKGGEVVQTLDRWIDKDAKQVAFEIEAMATREMLHAFNRIVATLPAEMYDHSRINENFRRLYYENSIELYIQSYLADAIDITNKKVDPKLSDEFAVNVIDKDYLTEF